MRTFRAPARLGTAVLAVLLAVVLAGMALAATADTKTPQGWNITPAGRTTKVLRFPLGLAAAKADDAGSQVITTSDSGGLQGLNVIDASSMNSVPSPAANLFMGLAVLPDGRVFASGGNADRVFRYRLAGPTLIPLDATEAATFPSHHILDTITSQRSANQAPTLPASDGLRVTGYPGNMVLDAAAHRIYVAGTLSEPGGTPSACAGQADCARVTVIDTEANGGLGGVVTRIPVGLDAYGLALDAKNGRLYVSNWADEAGRGNGTGTVSVVDLKQNKEIAVIPVGHHPSAVQLNGNRVFVANTNDDTLSVIDTATSTVVSTEDVRPMTQTPVGSHPQAFALSPDGSLLFVAMASLNAIEVRDGHTGAPIAGQNAYIPTGWYPASLLVTGTAKDYRLWVANARGNGQASGYNSSVFLEGNDTGGSVQSVTSNEMASKLGDWTAQVRKNDQLDQARVDPCRQRGPVAPSEVLCGAHGKSSPIKHVLYIVTENKTFDQYFGDIGGGYDADPSYALYGRTVTPNHHALADRYSLNDRFFSDADVSVTGHSWTAGGIATDHNEKTWPADYDQGLRGTHGGGDPLRPSIGQGKAAEGDDELQDPEGGYIFEAFKRKGAQPPSLTPTSNLTMGIYGERTARESGNMDAYKAPHWKDGDIQYFDTCRAHEFISGKAPDGPVPNGTPNGAFDDCQGRTLPPQFTLKGWNDAFKATGKDVMPNFMYMSLPVNHTLGTNLGNPTPASMVADNDHAIGMIVDALSHSPFWKNTAVVTTEDDTQAAGDHISSLRDYLHVISPWAKKGPNHQWGSMPSLLRTIETIFKIPPMNVYDKVALPQHSAFLSRLSDKPDLAPYNLQQETVPYAINEPGAPMQAQSSTLDFRGVDHLGYDQMALLNQILYAAQGKAVPPSPR